MHSIDMTAARITLGGRTILNDVGLQIGSDEFIGVLGPNGAGKTTLMRALLGLVPLAAGSLRVLGQPVTRGNPAIGYMPQLRATAGIGRLRGWDFVASAVNGQNWGLPRATAATRTEVARVLALVEAEDLAQRPLAELSGGQRQRLLLAQSLLGDPRLLLLDEPLISLDPNHQHAMVALVRRVQRAAGITVLFTAHELNPLLGALDRVLYLGGGHAALGTVPEVINSAVLSRLYGAPIEVVELNGRIFVMSGAYEMEADAHRHDHGGHGHGGHAHGHTHGHR